jgi:hypothetical protein
VTVLEAQRVLAQMQEPVREPELGLMSSAKQKLAAMHHLNYLQRLGIYTTFQMTVH